MFTSSFEAMYSAFSRMHMQRTWDAIINAPLSLDDVVFAEWVWAASKAVVSTDRDPRRDPAARLRPLVARRSWILPLGFLIGLTFGAFGLVMNALAPGYDFFTYFFTLVLTPMLLLSGVFFPVDQMPPALAGVAEFLPLKHAIDLARPLLIGNVPDAIALHVAVLLAYACAALLRRAGAHAPPAAEVTVEDRSVLRAVPARARGAARGGADRARRERTSRRPTAASASPAALDLAYHANLESRLASRILWRVAHGRYRNEDDLYALAHADRMGAALQRRAHAARRRRGDALAARRASSSRRCKVKDAVCDRFRAVTGNRPSVDKQRPDVRVHAFLGEREATLYLDTSGEALFKRGYRREADVAPLRENLAAGLIALSGWTPGTPLLDPMCGSGTIAIEAALIAADRAPGLGRTFGFQKLAWYDGPTWQRIRQRAHDRVRAAPDAPTIFASDVDARVARPLPRAISRRPACAGFVASRRPTCCSAPRPRPPAC